MKVANTLTNKKVKVSNEWENILRNAVCLTSHRTLLYFGVSANCPYCTAWSSHLCIELCGSLANSKLVGSM